MIYALQIGASLCLQIGGRFVLSQIRTNVTNWGSFIITNWGSYYQLGQPLLQHRTATTNWGKIYYKLGQVLQSRTIIKNWGIIRDGGGN